MSRSFAAWRERLGLTQAEVAKAAGLHPVDISQLERAQRLSGKVRTVLQAAEERRASERRNAERDQAIDRAWAESESAPIAPIVSETLRNVARTLLDAGNAEVADQLLDALPRPVAIVLLDEYFADDFAPGKDET